MKTYIHQLPEWPHFQWDSEALSAPLAEIRHRQGRLLGRMESLGFGLKQEAVPAPMPSSSVDTADIWRK